MWPRPHQASYFLSNICLLFIPPIFLKRSRLSLTFVKMASPLDDFANSVLLETYREPRAALAIWRFSHQEAELPASRLPPNTAQALLNAGPSGPACSLLWALPRTRAGADSPLYIQVDLRSRTTVQQVCKVFCANSRGLAFS